MGGLNENGPKDSCIRMLNPVSGTVWGGSGGVAFLVRGAGSLGVGLRGFKYSMPFPVSTLYSFSQRLPGKLLCTLSALCLWIRYKLSATAWAPCFPACMDSKLLIKYPPPAFLCNLGYTGTHSIEQASLEFRDLPAYPLPPKCWVYASKSHKQVVLCLSQKSLRQNKNKPN